MDPENKELLRKILDLSQKNNRMLGSIKTSMFWGRVFHYIYWIVIIGAAIGAYYFIEPYISQIIGVYGGIKGDINGIFN